MEKAFNDDIIINYLSGEISKEEKELLLRWLQDNPEHINQFYDFKKVWELSSSPVDDPKARQTFQKFQATRKTKELHAIYKNRINTIISIAASIVILLAIGFTYLQFVAPSDKNTVQEKYVITQIPVGQKGNITLTDGTRIWLNSGTTLKYPLNYSEKNRKVELDGEAYFDVVKDPSHPFMVQTDKLSIEVLGTEFNLKSYREDDHIETTLIEGSIKIRGNQGMKLQGDIYMKPNERAVYSKNDRKLVINNTSKEEAPGDQLVTGSYQPIQMAKAKSIQPSIQAVTSWKDNKLIFNNDTFDELVTKLERWYGVNIEVKDETLEKNVYSGKFVYNESIERVLDVLSRTTPIKYKIKRNSVIIESSE